jgi:hypothetical protein
VTSSLDFDPALQQLEGDYGYTVATFFPNKFWDPAAGCLECTAGAVQVHQATYNRAALNKILWFRAVEVKAV